MGCCWWTVEPQHRGTWYRACGFEVGGGTKGFARASRDFSPEHGVLKQLHLTCAVALQSLTPASPTPFPFMVNQAWVRPRRIFRRTRA